MKNIMTCDTPTAVAEEAALTPDLFKNLIFTATEPKVGGVTRVAKDAATCACKVLNQLTLFTIKASNKLVEAKYVRVEPINATPAHCH